METEDPREALQARDLPVQAAGARDLALMGEWRDLTPLLELAGTARRTGLRLITAAAAADIVHRYRTGRAEPAPTTAQVTALLDRVKLLDPAANPNALMVLSAFPEPSVLERLGRLLRDPRNTVRLGAQIALRRMALSHTAFDLERVGDAIPTWLADPRIPSDSRAELIRLAGEAGYRDLLPTLESTMAESSAESKALTTALERLSARTEPATWDGVWVSDGRDVLEPGPVDGPPDVLIVGEGSASHDFGPARPLILDQGRVRIEGEPPLGPLRQIIAPRLGYAEAHPALQSRDRTWYRAQVPDELVDLMRVHAASFNSGQLPATLSLPTALEAADSNAARRALPLAHLLTDQLDVAEDKLSSLVAGKRPRAEDLLWMARVHDLRGRAEQAIALYQEYLTKSSKKPWGVQLAEARVSALTSPSEAP